MGLLAVNEMSCGPDSVALRVTGVVGDDTVEQFEQAIEGALGAGLDSLVLDLTGCRLESAGLAALIRLQRSEERRPEATLLVTTDVDLLWTLQVVGLTYFCEVFATLAEALEASSATALSIAGAPHE